MILAQAQRRGQVAGRGRRTILGGGVRRDQRVGHRRDLPVSDVRDRSHRPYCLSVGRSCAGMQVGLPAASGRPGSVHHPLGIQLDEQRLHSHRWASDLKVVGKGLGPSARVNEVGWSPPRGQDHCVDQSRASVRGRVS